MTLVSTDPSLDMQAEGDRMLRIDRDIFRERFNRRHFPVEHGLSGNPLFSLPRLIELARDTALNRPKDLYYDAGVPEVFSRWGTSPCPMPVDDAIRQIEGSDVWIILKRAESDPAYATILNACLSDLLEVSGRELEKNMRRKEVIIFITSPKRLSTYHIDSECNFLLQVTGEKEISVFRPDDREVLPEEEIERFWTIETNAAVYKPHLQSHADRIHLKPGMGIHIPVNAPHWVQNGDNVSVSVSINYHSWDSERAHVYCTNYYLRKLGLDPTPPFQSPLRDTLKRPIGAALMRVREARYGPVRLK
jgi:hypothetical protein